MAIDYDSHPTELVEAGKVEGNVSIKELKAAIPSYCFQPSYLWSLFYLARDVVQAGGAMWLAYNYIPLFEDYWIRCLLWAAYCSFNGLVFCGMWILGHESGHSAFSKSDTLNNSVGFLLHSFLLTPYFSWRSTHRRHHVYANNMVKDHNYVPPLREQYAVSLLFDTSRLEELTEDSPIVTLLRILLQQAIGFPWYLLTNITAAPGSLPKEKSAFALNNSHFAPGGSLFRPEEFGVVLLSDIGVAIMAYILWQSSLRVGATNLLLLYGVPYVLCNNWIVAITYLHHTHPDLPKYEAEAWTFLRGATATVDRHQWGITRYFFHNIVDFHVIHHLFPRIPWYYGEEATNAVIPLLGNAYHADKGRPWLVGLWESFTRCQWVEPDDPDAKPADRALWYKGGPSPPVEISMGHKGFW